MSLDCKNEFNSNMMQFNNNSNFNQNNFMNNAGILFQDDSDKSNFKQYAPTNKNENNINNMNNNNSDNFNIDNNNDNCEKNTLNYDNKKDKQYKNNEDSNYDTHNVIINLETVQKMISLEPKILNKGIFTDNQINQIKNICFSSLNLSNLDDTKNDDKISQKLKQKYMGEWFVLICQQKSEKDVLDFDFKFTNINKGNTLIFSYKNLRLYITKIK